MVENIVLNKKAYSKSYVNKSVDELIDQLKVSKANQASFVAGILEKPSNDNETLSEQIKSLVSKLENFDAERDDINVFDFNDDSQVNNKDLQALTNIVEKKNQNTIGYIEEELAKIENPVVIGSFRSLVQKDPSNAIKNLERYKKLLPFWQGKYVGGNQGLLVSTIKNYGDQIDNGDLVAKFQMLADMKDKYVPASNKRYIPYPHAMYTLGRRGDDFISMEKLAVVDKLGQMHKDGLIAGSVARTFNYVYGDQDKLGQPLLDKLEKVGKLITDHGFSQFAHLNYRIAGNINHISDENIDLLTELADYRKYIAGDNWIMTAGSVNNPNYIDRDLVDKIQMLAEIQKKHPVEARRLPHFAYTVMNNKNRVSKEELGNLERILDHRKNGDFDLHSPWGWGVNSFVHKNHQHFTDENLRMVDALTELNKKHALDGYKKFNYAIVTGKETIDVSNIENIERLATLMNDGHLSGDFDWNMETLIAFSRNELSSSLLDKMEKVAEISGFNTEKINDKLFSDADYFHNESIEFMATLSEFKAGSFLAEDFDLSQLFLDHGNDLVEDKSILKQAIPQYIYIMRNFKTADFDNLSFKLSEDSEKNNLMKTYMTQSIFRAGANDETMLAIDESLNEKEKEFIDLAINAYKIPFEGDEKYAPLQKTFLNSMMKSKSFEDFVSDEISAGGYKSSARTGVNKHSAVVQQSLSETDLDPSLVEIFKDVSGGKEIELKTELLNKISLSESDEEAEALINDLRIKLIEAKVATYNEKISNLSSQLSELEDKGSTNRHGINQIKRVKSQIRGFQSQIRSLFAPEEGSEAENIESKTNEFGRSKSFKSDAKSRMARRNKG